jgi:hypothetical protein
LERKGPMWGSPGDQEHHGASHDRSPVHGQGKEQKQR